MLSIIWTDIAIEDTIQNIEYLEREWTEREVLRYIKKIDEVLEKLSRGNIKFKPTKYENTFQVPIVKQITLFYEKDDGCILLLRFWNNYQNPDKFNLK
jgi:plasmid stabilization system protein ParE